MDLLLEMYRQCNEHLRHSDSKRDQLLAFYAAIVAVFFNALDQLEKSHLLTASLVALVAFGLCVIAASVNYWGWHVTYGRTLFVLRNLMLSHRSHAPWPPSWVCGPQEIERAWALYDCGNRQSPLGWRTEFWVLAALTSISGLPVLALAKELLQSCPPAVPWALAVLYVGSSIFVGRCWVGMKLKDKPSSSWFFKCLEGCAGRKAGR